MCTTKANATINCPYCQSNNVTTIDNESLSNNDASFFDTEMYAKAQCNDCKETFQIQGTINWKQPEPIVKKEKFNICVVFTVTPNGVKDLEDKIRIVLEQSGIDGVTGVEVIEVAGTE